MRPIDPEFVIRSRQAFNAPSAVSLLDLKQRITACDEYSPIRKRDMLSALNRVEHVMGRPLSSVTASPPAIRALFHGVSGADVGVSAKTLANIRSAVTRAVRDNGDAPRQLTKRIIPAPEWQALLDRITVHFVRTCLYRLATFCTVMQIDPSDVTSTTLIGLHEALVEEELVKQPRSIIKNTISNWNRCARTINGWPNTRLSSPFKQAPYTLPLESFPRSFQRDVQAYADRVLNPDPLGEFGPDKPLRRSTVDHHIVQIRQFASALIHRGVADPPEITSLSFLFEPSRFKESIRFLLERNNGETTQRIHTQVNALRHIAKHHCNCDEDTLSQLAQLGRRLNPGTRGQMTERNRMRLRQFDDPAKVARLLEFPERQVNLAKKERCRVRAARRAERAVAVALLTNCGLRISSLRMIDIDKDLSWSQPNRRGVCHMTLPGDKVKTGIALEFELPSQIADLLRLHVSTYRIHLPGAESSWLFAGQSGKPRSKNALREAITRALKKDAGLAMNPHLFRHAIAKIAVEQDPGAYLAVSRVLGHSTLDTTTGYYLGTETKAATRHIDRLLDQARNRSNKTGKR